MLRRDTRGLHSLLELLVEELLLSGRPTAPALRPWLIGFSGGSRLAARAALWWLVERGCGGNQVDNWQEPAEYRIGRKAGLRSPSRHTMAPRARGLPPVKCLLGPEADRQVPGQARVSRSFSSPGARDEEGPSRKATQGEAPEVTTMQAAVQDRILTAVAMSSDVSTSAVLKGCPRGANVRDLQRALELMFAAHVLTGPPYTLTAEGRLGLVPAQRRCREREGRTC
jgi:hypothetical protein